MKKKNFAKFEIVCYVVAGLLAITAIYMTAENIAYMNEYVAAYGMTLSDLGSQAVQTVLSAFVPYFAYAFLTFAAGRIYHAVAAPKCECVCEEKEEVMELEAPVESLEAPAEEVVEVIFAETPETVVAEETTVETKEN